jgi:hypothetical protein
MANLTEVSISSICCKSNLRQDMIVSFHIIASPSHKMSLSSMLLTYAAQKGPLNKLQSLNQQVSFVVQRNLM